MVTVSSSASTVTEVVWSRVITVISAPSSLVVRRKAPGAPSITTLPPWPCSRCLPPPAWCSACASSTPGAPPPSRSTAPMSPGRAAWPCGMLGGGAPAAPERAEPPRGLGSGAGRVRRTAPARMGPRQLCHGVRPVRRRLRGHGRAARPGARRNDRSRRYHRRGRARRLARAVGRGAGGAGACRARGGAATQRISRSAVTGDAPCRVSGRHPDSLPTESNSEIMSMNPVTH